MIGSTRKCRAGARLALLAACALLSGCAAVVVGGGAYAYTALEDRRTAGSQLEDESNEVRAVSRIAEQLGDAVHVNVTSFNRAVLLTGEAPDARARQAVEKIAAGLPNVRSVTNELEIAGVSSLAARTNDSLITSKVKVRFLDAKRFNALHVKVVTESGIVYLMGIVTEQEANDAVEIARTTGGVRKVVKIFEYCKPSDEMCRPPAPAPAAPPAQRARSAP
jgi:osmotically-inducible protein OsmY